MLKLAYAQETAYLATLEALVRFETPTEDKLACDALADHMAELLASDGWDVSRHSRSAAGDILEARIAGGAGPKTLLLTHYDTVWPVGTEQRMSWRRDGNLVYGPGTCDMKGGIAAAIHALKLLQQAGMGPAGDVTLLITSDEESGSHHSRELIESLARAHDRVLVLETSRDDGAIKIGRKGVGAYRVTFRGRSAHSGNNPEQGASALRELAHFLLFAEELANQEAQTTVNLTVASGGTVVNVIAEEAQARLDVRVLRAGEAERVDAAIRTYRPRDSRVQVNVEGGLNRPPLEPTAGNAQLWSEAQERLLELGLSLEGAIVGGGSDGNFTSAIGLPTLDGLGSSGAASHARNEHIRLQETLERVALLASLLNPQATSNEAKSFEGDAPEASKG
ncbi:MAG: M20 family metallopeptidase [Trueperaceae bacterium]